MILQKPPFMQKTAQLSGTVGKSNGSGVPRHFPLPTSHFLLPAFAYPRWGW